jgi:hypothetical protein
MYEHKWMQVKGAQRKLSKDEPPSLWHSPHVLHKRFVTRKHIRLARDQTFMGQVKKVNFRRENLTGDRLLWKEKDI